MFKKLQELRQQKAQMVEQMREMLANADKESRSLNEEEAGKFDGLKAKVDEVKKEIERLEAVTEEERSNPNFQQVEKSVNLPNNDELRHWIKTGELRTLATNTNGGSDGGYAVIPELDKQVMKRLADESVMRSLATTVKISGKEYKKLVSVGGATVGRGSEGEARSGTTTPQMQEVTIALHNVFAYPKTTQEILDFGSVDIMGWLTDEISETFTETEESDLVNGTGEKMAKGFLAYSRSTDNDKTRAFGTLQKMEVTANKLTADTLIDLLYSLKAGYRKNAVWVMNSQTAGHIQKLKNGNGDYIWRDGLQAGVPAMLLGLPVRYLETMPDLEAGNAFLAVGDFKRGYTIVDHETGVRTRPDNLTEPGFYKVHTDKYLGGGIVDSKAIKVLEAK